MIDKPDLPNMLEVLTVTLSSEEISDDKWSAAAYYIDEGDRILAHGWQRCEGEIRMSFYQSKPVAIIVAGFYLGFEYTIAGDQLNANGCRYIFNKKKRPRPMIAQKIFR